MHVCFVALDYHEGEAGGGIASYVDALGRRLVERGHRVTVLAKSARRQVTEEGGMRIVRFPLGNLHWYFHKLHAPSVTVLPVRELEWSLCIRRQIDRLLAESPIDILESYETGVLLLGRKPSQRPPLIVRLHGDQYTFARYAGGSITTGLRIDHRLQMAAWRRASELTAPTRFHADEVARDLGWPSGTIQVIPNPVSPWMMTEALREPANPKNEQNGIVLYTGRIERRKGTLTFLNCVPAVVAAEPDTRFVVAGALHASINQHDLDRALDQSSARKHVQMAGHVPWRELPAWYRKASVFVMPSYYETFGISVVEAMAFGLPVVATTAGGLPEVVEDGVTGILVPPGDHQALAQAIVCLLRDPSLRRRMGEAGRERVLQHFTVDHVLDQTLDVYRSVLTP